MRQFLVGSLLLVTASCGAAAPRVEPASPSAGPPTSASSNVIAESPTPVTPDARSPFSVGDRVSCNWKSGGAFYEGQVSELRAGNRIFIQYDDGDVEETSPELCRIAGGGSGAAGAFRVGDRVSCNWRSGGRFYDGRVGELRGGGRLFIQYDDGDTEETTTGMCKASSTAPIKTGGTFKKGERVSCNWQSGGTFYDGKVADLRPGGRIFIQYDDGDTEETSPSSCRSLGKSGKPSGPLRAGDRVACNWLGQGTFYSGRVAEVRAGGKLFIQYDDGDQEETKPSHCRRL
jgi:hypothetical protein